MRKIYFGLYCTEKLDLTLIVGIFSGGKDLKYEWNRIGTCNIMICTPGRLLQHMTENAEFNYSSVQVRQRGTRVSA